MIESLQEETAVKGVKHGTDWAAELASLEGERAGEPEWLAERRRDAMARFRELGYPTTKLEAWRYTNVAPLARTRYASAPAEPGAVALEELPLADLAAIRVVLVDGRFVPDLSSTSDVEGLVVGSLAKAVEAEPDRLRHVLATHAPHGVEPFHALNGALFVDGAFVRVASGMRIERPIHVHHLVSNADEPVAIHARTLVVLEENAEATVIESYGPATRPGAGAYLTNAVTEAVVRAGARLDHYKLQEEGPEATHLATTQVRVHRDAEARSFLAALGSAVTRNALEVAFADPGGSCALRGLYVVDGEQHADCQTFVDHAVPHCTSDQNYRGILAGSSRGVFQGGVLVRPDAQHTNAAQSNKNLVLSHDAKADTKPQLEIHADDVKCAHGATIGELDPASIFFLRSRGIDEAAARSMLTSGFAGEVSETIRVDALREHVDRALASRLEAHVRESVEEASR